MSLSPNEPGLPPGVRPVARMSASTRPSTLHRLSRVVSGVALVATLGGVILAIASPTAATAAGLLLCTGFIVLITALIVFFVTRPPASNQTGQPKGQRSSGWGSSYSTVWDDDFGCLMVLIVIPLILWLFCATLLRPQAQKTLERFLTILRAGDVIGAQNLVVRGEGLDEVTLAATALDLATYRGLSEVVVHDAQLGNPSAGKSVTGLATFGERGKAPMSARVAPTPQGWRVVSLTLAAPNT